MFPRGLRAALPLLAWPPNPEPLVWAPPPSSPQAPAALSETVTCAPAPRSRGLSSSPAGVFLTVVLSGRPPARFPSPLLANFLVYPGSGDRDREGCCARRARGWGSGGRRCQPASHTRVLGDVRRPRSLHPLRCQATTVFTPEFGRGVGLSGSTKFCRRNWGHTRPRPQTCPQPGGPRAARRLPKLWASPGASAVTRLPHKALQASKLHAVPGTRPRRGCRIRCGTPAEPRGLKSLQAAEPARPHVGP